MNSTLSFAKWLLLAFFLLTGNAAHSALVFDQDFTTGFANNGNIPDGDPSGWQNSQVLSGIAGATEITDVRVVLNISGGWNGDLYAWLRHETAGGTGFSVLLNRAGTPGNGGLGYSNPGFDIVFSTTGTADLHNYQNHAPSYNGSGQLTGTWQPDGVGFSSFNNLDANGTWTLFVADLSELNQSQVVSWGLEIQAVPEPVNLSLAAFAAIFGLFAASQHLKSRRTKVRAAN